VDDEKKALLEFLGCQRASILAIHRRYRPGPRAVPAGGRRTRPGTTAAGIIW